MSPVLSLRGICVAYGKVEAVRDVSVDVQPGQIVTIIGPNGAGKSSLLAAAMGLTKCQGAVDYDGSLIQDLPAEDRVAHGLCLVPEQRDLFGSMTVEDNLRLGAFKRGRQQMQGRLEEVYARFPRLKERRAQLAGTLSGGERQMLAMGRALMAAPRVLMLDEPSLGLAPRIVRDIFDIIVDLRTAGVSVLLVEQNARAALHIADHAYVMELGAISMSGKASSIATDARIIRSYLGSA
ncbi:MAG: ABC transporter ATP-binding protein [Hyphomicrobiaceae bacterium]